MGFPACTAMTYKCLFVLYKPPRLYIILLRHVRLRQICYIFKDFPDASLQLMRSAYLSLLCMNLDAAFPSVSKLIFWIKLKLYRLWFASSPPFYHYWLILTQILHPVTVGEVWTIKSAVDTIMDAFYVIKRYPLISALKKDSLNDVIQWSYIHIFWI